jgi:hypothetical protein
MGHCPPKTAEWSSGNGTAFGACGLCVRIPQARGVVSMHKNNQSKHLKLLGQRHDHSDRPRH